MLRRLKLFGVGLFIGLVIIFSNEKLKNNFLEYIDWGDSNDWVINNLKFEFEDTTITHDIHYLDNVKDKLVKYEKKTDNLLEVLDGGWENIDKRKKFDKGSILFGSTLFVIDKKLIDGDELSVYFIFDEKKHHVTVKDFYLNEGISKKSYLSYLWNLAIFLIIMVPVLLFLRKLIRKRRLKDH